MFTKLTQEAHQAQPAGFRSPEPQLQTLREIPLLLSNLEGVITDAEAAIQVLCERLGPMRMSVPTAETGAQSLRFAASSPLGSELAANLNRLCAMTSTVNSAVEELAV